jgi:hypothetical protein
MTLLTEQKLSLNNLAQREGVNVSTAWRWVLRGVRGIRLESYCAGGRRYTTEPAWVRFCEATTAVAHGGPRTHSSRTTAADGAARRLACA